MFRVRVNAKRQTAPEIFVLELESENSETLPSFSLGVSIDVRVLGECVRMYSLGTNGSGARRDLLGVLRDGNSIGSALALHSLNEGDVVEIYASETDSVASLVQDDRKANKPFEIELASSGEVIRVRTNQTAIEALIEHGVLVPTSCERGVCGTCVTRVLDGLPDHRDVFLTEWEHMRNDQFTPCCSRSKTARLVIDL
ncbi:ferredoxin [Paraburkholderia sp. WC7.3g]|uniref:flavin reductase family protein n=1 Tax=Paraburkholderia sp. WC7.3g TaxID=2991070 RepID=UPI003D1A5AFB